MAIDLSALQKQKAMIDKILELAENPDAQPYLQMLLAGEKGSTELRSPGLIPRVHVPINSNMGSGLFPDDEDNYGRAKKGGQIATVRRVIDSRTGQFSVADIGDQLRSEGMDISNIAVGRVLQRLAVKYNEIKVAVRGEGASPNLYEKTEKLRVA